MDDRSASPNRSPSGDRRPTVDPPVRSRWSPKPEQIVILESIFNSGMVNPPKDETVRIRKLLEKFGAVGDANVFYWFQNRRSRSRRRQRQLQAAGLASAAAADPRAAALFHVGGGGGGGGGMQPSYYYEPTSSGSSSSSTSSSTNSSGGGCYYFNPCASSSESSPSAFMGDDGGAVADDLFSISRQMGLVEGGQMNAYYMCGSDVAQMNYQPAGTISVFINGILSEVPSGPLDLRAMFGHNVMLVNSSGDLLPVNEYGILLQSLQMGESYFLVSSSA